MKKSKILKQILLILICVPIILIGFFGIYSKEGNLYKNKLPKYELAADLKGETVLEFEVDSSSEKEYYDKAGNKVDSEKVTEKNKKKYTEKEIFVNPEENLNVENYNKVVDIMKQRLKLLQADQYRIDLNEETGKILLIFEDDYPDDIKSILPMEGKLELIDSNTEDVILTHTDFTKVEATNAYIDAANNGSYTIYLNLKLNKSGLEKINNIDKYKTKVDEEKNETTVNKFKVMFDKDELAEISYNNMLLTNNKLRITTAENLTSESEINSKLNTNVIVSKLATMGKLPVVYNIVAEEYINSDAHNYFEYMVMGIVAICVIISVYYIIRYKLKGIFVVIAFVTNIALFSILIRLTNVEISLNGLVGILGLIVLNTILIENILKTIKNKDKNFSENVRAAYLKTIDAFIIVLIMFAVFAFSSMTVINSMGLLVFWGWLVIILGNLVFTVPMLNEN